MAESPRATALLLGALMVAGALSGAARAEDAPVAETVPVEANGRPELVLWHAYRAREQEALERFIVELNRKETRFRVTVLAVPYDAYLDKITAAIPRGRGPDVFVAAHDTIGDWAEAKTIDVVDDVLDPPLIAQLQPGLVPAVLYRGHAYGVPLAFKSVALWRNTALVPNAPATLAEFEDAARKNTADGRYGLVYENRLFYFHAPFLFGFGGHIFDDSGRPTLDAANNIESVRYAQRLARELAVVPQEANGSLVTSLFVDGKAAMIMNGPWALGDIGEAVPLAVSPLPKTNDGKPLRPFLSVEAAFISGKSSKRALAVELVRALAGPECSARRLVEGAQPVALRAAWDSLDDANRDAPILRAFLAQQADAIPTPNTPAMKSVWSPFDLALGAALGQGIDPQTPLQEAQAKVAAVVQAIETGPQKGSSEGFAVCVVVVVLLLGGAALVGVLRYGPARLIKDALAQKAAYAYVAPAMIGMAVLVFVPFAVGIGMGFFEHTWGSYTFVGLENFKKILAGGDSRFFYTLGMTILWTASNVFLHVVIGVFLALLLSQARLRFRALYRVLFIVPWAVPNYITALIWKGMFHPELGAINQALGLQGFSWMNETWSAFFANLITNTWLGFPFMMVIALGGLTSIPKDLYEAAALDGASAWQRFSKITLPLLMPTLAPAIVLGTVWTFNMFNVIYLVSGGAPQGKTDILITEAFRWAFERGQGGAFGYAAAYSTLVFLMLVGYTTAANRVAAKVAEVRP